ncbi:RNA-directed DNA polymerase, eukaryota, reverse transcriptase zinc-binding domain protein [Tanacetum coccineum]
MGVLRELENIRKHFFNGQECNSKKATWVNWEKALSAKDRGGLGISSLFAMNRALLFKWVWRFFSQDNTLWARVIKAIHGSDGRIGTSSNSGNFSSCWTTIINETKAILKKGIDLRSYMQIKVGNGVSTKFWEDKWCEEGVLKDRFPRVYALEMCKNSSVASKSSMPSLSSSFRRNPRGGCELEQFLKVEDLVKKVTLAPMSDRWIWKLENTGEFSVASVRRKIDEKMMSSLNCNTRWVKYVPIKVNVQAWKVMTDSLPTRFNISRRGICIDLILCAICNKGVETSRHLFFSCELARHVMNLIIRWWNVSSSVFESYEEWLEWFVNIRLPSKNKKMFKGVFYVTWWLLWWLRNKTIFEGKTIKKAMLFDEVIFAKPQKFYNPPRQ